MGATSRRGRPKSEDLSRRIVDAATRLFARQGVDRTSTREIAAAAETTERTLFQHFGSKAGLLGAVIEQAVLAHTVPSTLESLGQDIRSFDGDLEAWHRQLLRSRSQAWTEAGDLTRILAVEMLRDPQLLERFVDQWRPAAWDPLVARFASLQEAGTVRRDVSAEDLARQFLSVNVSFLLWKRLPGVLAFDDEVAIAAIARLFATGAVPSGLP